MAYELRVTKQYIREPAQQVKDLMQKSDKKMMLQPDLKIKRLLEDVQNNRRMTTTERPHLNCITNPLII